MPDSYLPSSKLFSTDCGSPRRDSPQAEAYGDARIGGDQDTPETGNVCAAAVEQPDVAKWEPIHVILAGLAVGMLLNAALFAGWLWIFRGLAC